jgi:hypothetical protein
MELMDKYIKCLVNPATIKQKITLPRKKNPWILLLEHKQTQYVEIFTHCFRAPIYIPLKTYKSINLFQNYYSLLLILI